MNSNDQLANQSLGTSNAANDLDNIESIESIYSADTIEIIDSVSTQIISSDNNTPKSDQTAANEECTPGHIYSLDNARLIKKSKTVERREYKSRLTDRRSTARMTASVEAQTDRRDVNKIANIDAIRLAQVSK